MKSFCFLALCIVALANAATQPGPVYRSISANSSPAANLNNKPEPSSSFQQPSAEPRESQVVPTGASSSSTSTGGGLVGTSSVVSQQQPSSVPQSFYSVYYPASASAQPQQYYPQQQQQQVQPAQVYSNGMDTWTKYRMNDVMIGGAALGLILAGSYLVVPKLWSVRGRALRELSELDSEDLSRMAKSVFQAIDKVYDLKTTTQE